MSQLLHLALSTRAVSRKCNVEKAPSRRRGACNRRSSHSPAPVPRTALGNLFIGTPRWQLGRGDRDDRPPFCYVERLAEQLGAAVCQSKTMSGLCHTSILSSFDDKAKSDLAAEILCCTALADIDAVCVGSSHPFPSADWRRYNFGSMVIRHTESPKKLPLLVPPPVGSPRSTLGKREPKLETKNTFCFVASLPSSQRNPARAPA